MFVETMNPTEICSVVETTTRKRKAKVAANPLGPALSAPIAGGHEPTGVHSNCAASAPIANEEASSTSQPWSATPLVSDTITDDGQSENVPQDRVALVGSPTTAPAADTSQPNVVAPEWSSGHTTLEPYTPTHTDPIDEIINKHRLRSGMIKAQIKLTLQAMATVRFVTHEDGDYDTDESKAKARKKADDLFRTVAKDPAHPLFANIAPYLLAQEPLEAQRGVYEKEMAKLVKSLPIYEWAKAVKGLGEVGLATIVGECGDIGTYKSVSAVWKRMGLAVFDGNRQGNPGKGASAEDWTAHGYVKTRRSVMWNVGNSLILGMGKFRPLFGEDVQANEGYTYYQKVFAERARYEMAKLEKPITESKTGKESYAAHAANRAKRYTEKRLLRNLYIEWRRA